MKRKAVKKKRPLNRTEEKHRLDLKKKLLGILLALWIAGAGGCMVGALLGYFKP